MFRLICLIIGYFVGCIQTAYYVGKYYAKIDIREHGSGNAGTTNVVRTLGAKAGAITFLTDFLKTVLVYIICSYIFKGSGSFYTYIGEGANGFLPGLYGGLGLVLGHNFPAQLKFKGGKGVAATLAVFLSVNLAVALTSFALGITVLLLTSYISLTSMVTMVIYTGLALYRGFAPEETAIVAVLAAMVIVRHQENIKRLLSGTENKFTIKKKQ